MGMKTIFESIVVGFAAQVLVGWISPFTPLLTGFVAGIVTKDRKEGTLAGSIVGLATAVGFVLREYFELSLSYIYPTTEFLARAGVMGVLAIFAMMVIIGTIGGRVGGSVMQGSIENSYRHGRLVGEAKRRAEEYVGNTKKRSRGRL